MALVRQLKTAVFQLKSKYEYIYRTPALKVLIWHLMTDQIAVSRHFKLHLGEKNCSSFIHI